MDPERTDRDRAISATQIQPTVRCGKVPFGAANCTMPSANAAMAAKACNGIVPEASSSGASDILKLPGPLPKSSEAISAHLRAYLSTVKLNLSIVKMVSLTASELWPPPAASE